MIRRLRRRHLTVGVALLALAPAALGVAVRVRPAPPARSGFRPPAGIDLVRVPGLPLEIGSALGPIAFRATEPIRVPDPLLYWVPTLPQNTSIPARAVLLGPLSADRVTSSGVSLTALGSGGWFLIWDGGHGRAVAWAAAHLPSERGSTP